MRSARPARIRTVGGTSRAESSWSYARTVASDPAVANARPSARTSNANVWLCVSTMGSPRTAPEVACQWKTRPADVATRATLARLLARLSSATPSPRRKRTAVTTPRGASGSSCVAVLKRAEGRPVVASCARTMPSSHPNARRDPSGLNAAHCARVDVGRRNLAQRGAEIGRGGDARVRDVPAEGLGVAVAGAARQAGAERRGEARALLRAQGGGAEIRVEADGVVAVEVGELGILVAVRRGADRHGDGARRRPSEREAEAARACASGGGECEGRCPVNAKKAARVESSGGTNTKIRPLGATKRTTRGTTRVPPPRGVAGPPVGVTTPSRDRRAGRTRAPRLRVVFASSRPRVVDPSEALTVKSR